MGAPNAADMLGSQANETVLVEQPQAYITQKARVKRNRRTEWDYYVQFPGFPEDEGSWYSARAIKTSHPRGAELIREFEHPNDSPELNPQPAAQQRQPAQLAGPQTQDAGPSQIGSQSLYEPKGHSSYQQPHTQDHFASQLQQPADHISATAPTVGSMQVHQMHGLQAVSAQSAFNTASQNELPPPLHWSFDRMQQSAQPRCQQLLHPVLRVPPAQLQPASMQPLHSLPVPFAQPPASIPPEPYDAAPGRFGGHAQGSVSFLHPPGQDVNPQMDWSTSQQQHWQQQRQLAQGL